MKKMPCLFVREFHGHNSFTITEQVTPGCEWAFTDAICTRKWDGTAVMFKDGILYRRYDAKRDKKTGQYRMPPSGAIPCDEPDTVTGHWPHWVRVDPSKPEDKHHVAAFVAACRGGAGMEDGTYELCGPSFNGNPQGFPENVFRRHGDQQIQVLPSFEGIREHLEAWTDIEGFVFHHRTDGRMCKIRRADFGFPWGSKRSAA